MVSKCLSKVTLTRKTSLILFLLFFGLTCGVQAQKLWSVYGKVLNAQTLKPLESLTVVNQRTKHVVVTNKSGDFYIRAAEGDSLIIKGIGFGSTTTFWDKSIGNPTIGIEQQAIALEEVVVKDKRSETIEREIKDFLENPRNAETMKRDIVGNLVRTSSAGGLGGGAGLSIDAMYDLWSKEGKANRKAAELEYQDLKRFYIELRYNKRKVANITNLKDPDLEEFMSYCKLNNAFILEANDYDLTYQIMMCLREFNNTASFPVYRKSQ
jgi:hypothetical protein